MKAPKVGDRVQATAAAAMGKKLATQRYGANAKAKKLSGEIIASEGSRRGRKWRVRWDDDKIGESVHSSRVLENAESVEDIEDDVVMDERDSDEELPLEELAEAEPEMEEGREPTSIDRDPLVVKGIIWTIVDNLVDIHYIPKQRAHVLWNRTQQLDSESNRREVDYFLWSFPDKAVAEILECTTNSMLKSKPSSIPVSRGELFKLLGFLLALTRTHSKRRDLFSVSDGLFPAPKFGDRFGIHQHRVDELLQHISFGKVVDGDPAHGILCFIDHFNKCREDSYFPSWSICVDESMSAWRGKDGNFCSDGMPHVTKIARKPKGVGAELKDAADSETNIIIRLELQEGAERMAAKKFTDICQSKGTAQTLRLTEPWHHSGRTVNGDSAFASVQTAVELKRHGMFFKGMVKTAHSGFPKTYLDTVEYPERGDWITLAATVQGHCIFATGWGDMTRKNLVHTDGVSGEGTPHGKRRWRECDDALGTEVVIRYTKRPKVVEDYFDCAKVIDIANHMRQGGLALEQAWKTQKWEHRLFSTLLGMIETDAYCAWRHFHPDGANDEHADFTEELAQQLLTNTIDNVGTETRRSVSLENTILDVHADETLAHDIVLLTEHPKYARNKKTATGASKKALFRCHVCRNMATMYCKTCTMRIPHNTREMVIAVCSITSARKSRCINYHFMHGASI